VCLATGCHSVVIRWSFSGHSVVIRSLLGPACPEVRKPETGTCGENRTFGFLTARRGHFFQAQSWKKRRPLGRFERQHVVSYKDSGVRANLPKPFTMLAPETRNPLCARGIRCLNCPEGATFHRRSPGKSVVSYGR
jgi:hypothetical protein